MIQPIYKTIFCIDPAVMAAIITVTGMTFTVIANLLFNFFRGKAESEEKLFYDVYHKRMALYDDVIKELQAMVQKGNSINKIISFSYDEAVKMVLEWLQTLNILTARLRLFGSGASAEFLYGISTAMLDFRLKNLSDLKADCRGEAIALGELIEHTMNGFIIIVSGEGSNMADKKISMFLKKMGFKNKKAEEKGWGDYNSEVKEWRENYEKSLKRKPDKKTPGSNNKDQTNKTGDC